MQAKLALSFALAALILAAGGFLLVLKRLDERDETRRESAATLPRGRPPGVVPADEGPPANGDADADADADEDPLISKDPLVKLDYLVRTIYEMDTNAYDYYSDLSQDLYALKREVRQLKSTLKQIVQGLGRTPGGVSPIGWGLAPQGRSLDEATAKAYREAAADMGIQVEDGRITVRGFLNLSPNTNMPIEWFVTRYPEASHETLVHLIGDRELEVLAENPHMALKGLPTALYKGLMAAGFRPGVPTHPDPTSDPKNPTWVLASGDVVYMALRYEMDGETHIARATDWVLDPESGAPLPPDCFRFTGSSRVEDPNTGDAVLAAELMGHLVSVWPNGAALVEVSLEAALRNDFQYNFSRIPKPDREETLYIDVILSKTPIEAQGGDVSDGGEPPR